MTAALATKKRKDAEKANILLDQAHLKGKRIANNLAGKAKDVEDWIKNNPLLAIGGAFALGYLIGRMRRR